MYNLKELIDRLEMIADLDVSEEELRDIIRFEAEYFRHLLDRLESCIGK